MVKRLVLSLVSLQGAKHVYHARQASDMRHSATRVQWACAIRSIMFPSMSHKVKLGESNFFDAASSPGWRKFLSMSRLLLEGQPGFSLGIVAGFIVITP